MKTGETMRRRDREVTEDDKIDRVIANCHCCRLGFCDEREVYIVPLNFGYVKRDGKRIFYFHGAREGRKITLIERSHRAGFEMDANYQLKEGEAPCQYSACFQSIIGNGRVDLVEDEAEKEAGLQAIMAHHTGRSDWTFQPEMMKAVAVFRLVVESLSCKEHENRSGADSV